MPSHVVQAGRCLIHYLREVTFEGSGKTAEFILYRRSSSSNNSVWIVEAKSSSPRPDMQPNFDNFNREISEKFINSFSMYAAIKMGRHGNIELPKKVGNFDMGTGLFKFVLVIHGHKDSWLQPVKDELEKWLRTTFKTWALPDSVVVFNDELARKHGLIV